MLTPLKKFPSVSGKTTYQNPSSAVDPRFQAVWNATDQLVKRALRKSALDSASPTAAKHFHVKHLTGEPTGANAAERSAPSLNLKLSKLQPSKHWFMVNCRTNAVSGSYVTLFSPEAPPQWGGNFRIASLLNLQLEPDLLNDELFPEVAWDWFSAPLIAAGVKRLSGTFTIVKDQSFSSSSTWDSAPDALAHSDPPDVPDPSIISHDLNFSPHFAAEIQNQAQIRASWSWDETPDANLTTLADNSWSAWLKSVAKFNA